jgi:hypothetical protein
MTTHSLNQQQFADDFGARVTARLDASLNDIPHDISERLKVARMLALSKRKVVNVETNVASEAVVLGNSIGLSAGNDRPSWWNWIGSLLPLVALIVGMLAIPFVQDQIRAYEVAEVDAEILTDVLPPSAYTDPGFAQFVKANQKD